MKKVYNFKKEVSFNENVSSITSISLDTTFEEIKNGFKGVFLVEGNYKTHELSLNKKDFKYELDFNENIEGLCEGSLNLEVEDFTYELEENNLIIYIDYEVDYEEEKIKEEFDEEEFERFLEEHEVDVVNINEETEEDQNEVKLIEEVEVPSEEEEEIIEEEPIVEECEERELKNEEPIEEIDEAEEEKRDVNIISKEDEGDATDVILKTIDKEEKYITYHVYVCEEDDTFESISEKFKTTKEEIREYNDIDDIEYGRKIIIPVKDE